MGTLTAQDVLMRVDALVQDPQNTFWTQAQQLKWLSDAQRLVVVAKPDQNVTAATLQLAAGTRQALPTGKLKLIRVTRNMGTNGTTPGKAIRLLDIDDMNSFSPGWHSATESAEVKGYMFDPNAPKMFFVTPPQPGSNQGYIEYLASSVPAEITDPANTIVVDDVFLPVLVDYVTARCLAAESTENSANKANFYFGLVAQALGMDTQAVRQTDPNVERKQNG
jgi:hypothetical protein